MRLVMVGWRRTSDIPTWVCAAIKAALSQIGSTEEVHADTYETLSEAIEKKAFAGGDVLVYAFVESVALKDLPQDVPFVFFDNSKLSHELREIAEDLDLDADRNHFLGSEHNYLADRQRTSPLVGYLASRVLWALLPPSASKLTAISWLIMEHRLLKHRQAQYAFYDDLVL